MVHPLIDEFDVIGIIEVLFTIIFISLVIFYIMTLKLEVRVLINIVWRIHWEKIIIICEFTSISRIRFSVLLKFFICHHHNLLKLFSILKLKIFFCKFQNFSTYLHLKRRINNLMTLRLNLLILILRSNKRLLIYYSLLEFNLSCLWCLT